MADPNLHEFLRESNAIEGEHSEQALKDALKAWEHLKTQQEINRQNVCETQRLLLTNLRPAVAGHFRLRNVGVGIFVAPSCGEVPRLFNNLIQHVPETEGEIKQWHISFEKIHPFEDGNGRTGRIIMNWQRQRAGLPLLVIHVGEEQQDYYRWFQ